MAYILVYFPSSGVACPSFVRTIKPTSALGLKPFWSSLLIFEKFDTHAHGKEEKILKGSLDSIPSPPAAFKIMGEKVCFSCKGKTLPGIVLTQHCFALLPQVNFPTKNLNFHWRWRWWDQIKAVFLNLFYFSMKIQKHTLGWFWLHFGLIIIIKLAEETQMSIWNFMSFIFQHFFISALPNSVIANY